MRIGSFDSSRLLRPYQEPRNILASQHQNIIQAWG